MIWRAPTDPRLLFRVDPIPFESPRGYLCRVASAHGCGSPLWLLRLAGLSRHTMALHGKERTHRVAHVLRLDPEEWLAMSYRSIKETGRGGERIFYGRRVSAGQFNYQRFRICPTCLRERPVWWAVWDLALVAACPFHRHLLINQCPGCKKKLSWLRPAVERCRCGVDFRTLTAETANPELVAMSTLIYRAAGLTSGAGTELELTNWNFPSELARLPLDSLLRLIRFLGLTGEKQGFRRKQRPFRTGNLVTAIRAVETATATLKDWPQSFRRMLRGMVPEGVANAATLTFTDVFGNFYFHLFRFFPRNEFGFLHEAFEAFVLEDWNGMLRAHHRYLSVDTREKSAWISASEARKKAGIAPPEMEDLIRKGKLERTFVKMPRARSITECWIKRASLERWIKTRDAELGRYMSCPATCRALGLQGCTILRVAQAGLIRYVRGLVRQYPRGVFFLQEDVMKIKSAFEKQALPVRDYSKPGELASLRHARAYLVPAVIRAVVDGTLVPAAYTDRFPGITGYLFPANQIRMYRSAVGVQTPSQGFLTYSEAASRLGFGNAYIIAGLVAQGILGGSAELQSTRSKLVPAAELERFLSQHIRVKALAQDFGVTDAWLNRYLRKSGTQMLVVPAGAGRRTRFLRKEVAAALRISPPSSSHR